MTHDCDGLTNSLSKLKPRAADSSGGKFGISSRYSEVIHRVDVGDDDNFRQHFVFGIQTNTYSQR